MADTAEALAKLINDPVGLDYVLFPKSYPLIAPQKLMMQTFDDPMAMFIFLEAARGMSKSYTFSRWAIQKCAKVPKFKIVFSGPSFRQSQTPFRYAVEILEENGLEDQLLSKPPTMSNVRWEMVFKNGSKMIALPASAEKLHGERANIVMFEEFFAYPEELHNKTVKPMLAVQSNRQVANKAIYITSADFQFRWAYKRRCEIQQQAIAGNPKYKFLSLTIDDMPPREEGGFYSLDQLEDDRNSMPPDIFQQQYHNKWLSDSGTFYVLSVLMNPDIHVGAVELQGDGRSAYAMGIDVARSLRGNGDDSSISVWKVGDTNDALVNQQTYNNTTVEQLGMEVLNKLAAFPGTQRIALDYGGGGVYLRDFLYGHGIVEVDELDFSIPGKRILQQFPNNPETITFAHYQFKGGFNTKSIILPQAPDDGDQAKELVWAEIDGTLHQLANIEAKKLPSGNLKFDVASSQKKDSAYAAMYGYWACQQLKGAIQQEDAALIKSDIADLFDPLSALF